MLYSSKLFSADPRHSHRLRRHFRPNSLLSPILRVSFQKGKSWKNERQIATGPASSFSIHEAAETSPPVPSRGSGRLPACSRPLPGGPRPERGSLAHVRPFLFTLGDELLLSLSAVLALLFVFKSSYNFAPRFIANSIYLPLSRVSAQILQSFPPPMWTNHQGHGAGTRNTGMAG